MQKYKKGIKCYVKIDTILNIITEYNRRAYLKIYFYCFNFGICSKAAVPNFRSVKPRETTSKSTMPPLHLNWEIMSLML